MADESSLKRAASEHLWLHFSRLATDGGSELTMIERGEGVHVWDTSGRRYLDGLAGLFTVQVGHGRKELGEAAAKQASTLAYYPIWTYAHPMAALLSERIAALAPGDLNRVFLTSGGSEAVESAWKLARQYFLLIGQPDRNKVIARNLAYHGTTLGALAITGLDALKTPYLPLLNGKTRHVANTNRLHCKLCAAAPACTLACADEIEQAIVAEGAETVAAVYLEPVQNAGGCFTAADGYFARVREICDRYGVLLVSDEVICAFGRLGDWFGSARLGYQPDMITFAKGATSGYAPLGGVVVSDRIAEPFLSGTTSFVHGLTFGGHPVCCAVALANIDLMEREDLSGRVKTFEHDFRGQLETLLDLPIVSEVRGMGYFYGIEMTKGGENFTAKECEWLIRRFLSRRLLEMGLICRADDRGDPVIQLSPPLIAGPAEFEQMTDIIRRALEEAWKKLGDR
ncbi:MAG: aspartate aminotransferase family protein [Actinomycetota bacterium]